MRQIKDDKQRKDKLNGAYSWAICTDGSEKAIRAYQAAIRLMDKKMDNVEVIMVDTTEVNTEKTKIQYLEMMAADGVSAPG